MSPRNFRPGAPASPRHVAPFHRGPQALMSPPVSPRAEGMSMTKNAALLIDFDNVTMGIRSDLHSELKTLLSSDIIKGKPAVQRAYADWRRYPQYVVPLAESSIDMIMAPAYGSSKKNATDIRLAIDALELVFTRPDVTTFILLSGDSDFSSLVIKLKEYGKYVIGIGIRESSSDLLVMNCDEYYSYNALAGLVKSNEEESTRWDPWELVTEAVTRMKRNGDVMRSDRLKQVMQEIDNSFDEKDLGMPKFSRFVQEASQKGLLTVTKLESGQLEIDTPDAEGPSLDAAAPTAEPTRERNRDRGRGRDRDRDRDRGERDAAREPQREISREPQRDAEPVAEPEVEEAAASTERAEGERAEGERAPRERDDRRGRRGRRGRGRDRERGERPDSDGAADVDLGDVDVDDAVAAAFEAPSFGAAVGAAVGTTGERLTRSEAFDLVRRAVESLVEGEDTTSASATRQRAFELLGRDSESLSARNFERVLQDAHDAGMIDLRRRGDDFEVARAADAAPIVEQLKTADNAARAAAAANAPPAPPRGMAPRGVAGRGAGRGRGPGAPPPELLMVGVVPRAGATMTSAASAGNGASSAPVPAETTDRATGAADAAPIAASAERTTPRTADAVPAARAPEAPMADVPTAETPVDAPSAAATPAAAPAAKRGRAPAKAAKTPAAPAAAAPTAPARKAAKAPAKAAKTAGRAEAPAPAKKAAKGAKKTVKAAKR